MKTILLASTFLFAVAGSALGADAVVYEPAPEAVLAPAFTWTGGYVGGQVGYAWGSSHYAPGPIILIPSFDYDPDGLFGGIYAGYNYQFSNNVVLGVDADINFSGTDSSHSTGSDAHVARSEVKYTAALRARLGYAVDRWMPYIAGGISTAKYRFDLDHNGAGNWDFQDENTFTGWNISAGVEYAVTDKLLLRAEYRYSDFGDWNYDNSWANGNSVDLKTHDIRLGVAYKF